MKYRGFTLIEILVSLAIIGTLATLTAVMVLPARSKARDTARIAALNGIGRVLWASQCYVPVGGAGDYDLQVIFDEYVAANPAAAAYLQKVPRDPRSGTAAVSGYRYQYGSGGTCALYANLERADAAVDLPAISSPTAGGGTGTLQAASVGSNGTDWFYQVSR